MSSWSVDSSQHLYLPLFRGRFHRITSKNHDYFILLRKLDLSYAAPKGHPYAYNRTKFSPNEPTTEVCKGLAGSSCVDYSCGPDLIDQKSRAFLNGVFGG